jgi:hypothetical protein
METGNAIRELVESAPVVGWRAWVVTETAAGLRLGSVLYDEVWAPETTALAVCRRREDFFAEPLAEHATPGLECGCGYHAARDPADALSYLRGRNEPTTVCRILGEVAIWGRLVETEAGWRAAAAYPFRLYVPDDAIADALAVYGVPVVSASAPSSDAVEFLGREHQARGRTRPRPRLGALVRARVDSGAA